MPVEHLEVKRLRPPGPTGGRTAIRWVLHPKKHASTSQDWGIPISSNPETTGQSDLPSSRDPRWKSSWTALRTFSARHPVRSGLLGAALVGLTSGAFKVVGKGFAEHVLTWIS